MMTLRILFAPLLAACIELTVTPIVASCDEILKVAAGAPNNWDSGIPDVGQRAGIFMKHGLILDILYTNGGGETMQAVISGSADLGISAGTGGVFGAFAKGAPVRATSTGTYPRPRRCSRSPISMGGLLAILPMAPQLTPRCSRS